jgi:zinc protease
MKYSNYTLLFLAVLICFTGLFNQANAQTDRPERPELIEFPEMNPIQVPEVHRFTHRGIEFFLVEDPELPLISMSVRIRAGEWLVPEEKTGLASITGEVMRSGGTVNISADELNEMLENRAVSIETGFGLTSGTASLNLLKEDFDEMLPVFIELLTKPAFPQEKFDLAVTQRRSGIARRNDNPAGIAAREFSNLIYGKQTVFNRTTEYHHLDNIQLQDLIDFHRKNVVAENLMVGISGDFRVRDIRRKLEQAFNAVPSGTRNEFSFPEIDYEFISSINFIDRPDMNQSIIRIGHLGGFRDNPDYAALQVMNQVLSGGFSGRLMQEVRTRQGLAYSVGGSYSSSVLYPGVFFSGLSTASESTARAINATLHEIKRLQNEPVPQQELDDTRNRFLNSLVFRNENRASALFEQLNNTYLGLPLDAFEQYVEQVRNVTVEDIQRVAREYLQPDNVHILVVGNSNLIGEQLDEFGEVNHIDITIPRPVAQREEVTGDTAAGSEWLHKMKNAILGDNSVTSITFEGKTMMSGMNLDTKITYRFPSYLKQELNSPMGTQVLLYENGAAKVQMGGQEQQLPGQVAEQFRATLNRHYLNISMNADEFEAIFQGEETIDDIQVAKLWLPEIETNMYVSTETGLPVMVSFSQMNPQTGSDMNISVVYADWNESNGLKAAWSETQKADGNVMGSNTFSSHSFE